LTISGDGDTTITGLINGGGVLNSMGVAAGAITKNGAGTLHLTGAVTYSVPITASGCDQLRADRRQRRHLLQHDQRKPAW
jgi:hypothetical protein